MATSHNNYLSHDSSSRDIPTKQYMATAHPYVFDAFFAGGKHWNGSGRVTLHSAGGGVNQAWAIVEADDSGCLALTAAGFTLRRIKKKRVSAGQEHVSAKKRKATTAQARGTRS